MLQRAAYIAVSVLKENGIVNCTVQWKYLSITV